MKTKTLAILSLVFLTMFMATPALAQQAPLDGGPPSDLAAAARDSVIFRLDGGLSSTGTHARARALAAAGGGAVEHVYTTVFNGFSARMPRAAAEALRRGNPDIVEILPDGVVSIVAPPQTRIKAKPGGGGSLPPQVTPWGIDRVGGARDGTGRTVWVIDTGVDLDNADLNVDAARGISFVTRGRGADSPDDQNGHGTHVAGTVAAIDNAVGVVGVAAGAEVVAVRVLDHKGSGLYSWVIAGVDYVAANAAPGDVANMSLGGPAFALLDAAVLAAADRGVLFALAAGNESADASAYSPARVQHPNVYTVSAIDDRDVFAWFSNFGGPLDGPVDYAAPGVDVKSLFPGTTTLYLSGTSMAAPHVAGLLLFGPLADMAALKDCGWGCAIGDPDGDADAIANWGHSLAVTQ